jgi:hypothetical protein
LLENKRPVHFRAHSVYRSARNLLNREARVTNDAAESEGIDRIVARDRNDSRAVRHDDVLALPDDHEPSLLERAYGVEMIDAGDPGQDLNRYLDLANLLATKPLIDDSEISANGILDVLDGFCFGGALRPTPRQTRDRDRIALV